MVPLFSPSPAHALAWLAALVLLLIAVRDIAVRDIPNGFVLALVLIALARHVATGAGDLPASFLVATLVFAATFALWSRGMMGGGDAKLLPAAALLLPAGGVPGYLLLVALAGGVLALIHLGLRLPLSQVPLPPRPSGRAARILRCEAWRIGRGAGLPYGVAIALGALLLLARPGP